MVDKIKPMPTVNKNKQMNENGNNKCHQFKPVPVANITMYNGTSVNKKLIPTNKHFDKGNIYLGIYTLLISEKFVTTDVIAVLDASLK